jgi:hypothetical protein
MRNAVRVREQRAVPCERFDERRGTTLDDLRERLVFLDNHDDVRRTRERGRARAAGEREDRKRGDESAQDHGIE